jgi:hypothetical protein
MQNPWLNIYISEDKQIYAAKDDYDYIQKLLQSTKYKSLTQNKKKNYALKLNLYPQHFVGDIRNSKIIILSLNPGYNEKYRDSYLKKPKYATTIKNNLRLNKKTKFHAFDLSTPDDKGYWDKKLNVWFESKIKEKLNNNKEGNSSEELDKYFTNMISLAEFFPYHSESYNELYDKIANEDFLPTQQYVFDIIKNRINDEKDNVIIILSRSFKKWYDAIPELKKYEYCFETNNPSNPSFKLENIQKVIRIPLEEHLKNISQNNNFMTKLTN